MAPTRRSPGRRAHSRPRKCSASVPHLLSGPEDLGIGICESNTFNTVHARPKHQSGYAREPQVSVPDSSRHILYNSSIFPLQPRVVELLKHISQTIRQHLHLYPAISYLRSFARQRAGPTASSLYATGTCSLFPSCPPPQLTQSILFLSPI